jgi:hypothetical protein
MRDSLFVAALPYPHRTRELNPDVKLIRGNVLGQLPRERFGDQPMTPEHFPS